MTPQRPPFSSWYLVMAGFFLAALMLFDLGYGAAAISALCGAALAAPLIRLHGITRGILLALMVLVVITALPSTDGLMLGGNR